MSCVHILEKELLRGCLETLCDNLASLVDVLCRFVFVILPPGHRSGTIPEAVNTQKLHAPFTFFLLPRLTAH